MRTAIFFLLLLCLPITVTAQEATWAKFASTTGTIFFLSLGTLAPLAEDGSEGGQHTLRTADALATASFASDGLKHLIHEERPDRSDNKSFPSMHSATAFSVATMQAEYHPHQAVWWYLGATTIAASRVQLDKHHVHDVIAGAALGYAVARIELHQPHGILLQPWIDEDSPTPSFTLVPGAPDTTVTLTPWLGEGDFGVCAQCLF